MAKPKSKPKTTCAIRKKRGSKSAATAQAALRVVPNGAAPDISVEKDLWETAIQLRGNIAPGDYKHYVLPLLFLRYLSLKYERRSEQLELALKDPQSDYFTDDASIVKDVLNDPGIVDIFHAAGIEKADISILDERFLQEIRSKEFENLRLKLLQKLLDDEIQLRQRKNLKKYRSFKEVVEEMLRRYHANAITAAEVVRAMIQICKEMQSEDARKAETRLSDEELAFYDAIAGYGEGAFHRKFLCDLVREVVQAVKRNLKVEWTKPHRENVKAAVLAEAIMVLRRRHICAEQFQFILNSIMKQAEAMYEDYPMAA